MSIGFISGKPGGGKTLYSVRLIIDEIVLGNRPIVTNVPLLLGKLNAYLADKYPAYNPKTSDGSPWHISDRITLISEDDLGKFFTFRGLGVRLDSVSNVEWKAGKRPDFTAVKDGGVLYVLDEVHIAFNSREWAATGAEVLYYLSQHRKLGDDVICITQSIGNVDKQFRSVAQDFTYIKNLSKMRIGLFRLPGLFTRNTYSKPATDTSKPDVTGSFTLDMAGIASCYDTAQGVGIHGRAGADTNGRKSGLHWLWFAIPAPIILILFLQYLPSILSMATDPKKPVVPAPVHHAVPAGPVVPVPSASAGPDLELLKALDPSPGPAPAPVTNHLFCTGFTILGKDVVVFLSDGSSVASSSGRVRQIEPDNVTVDGVKLPVRVVKSVYTPARLAENQMPVAVYTPEPAEVIFRESPGIVVTPAIGGRAKPARISGLPQN